MKPLTIDEIVKATGGYLRSGSADTRIQGVSTDSRGVLPCDLFFALRGDTFDGHAFLSDVIARGCNAVVVSEANGEIVAGGATSEDLVVIEVSDTLKAYQDLAAYYRKLIGATVIAVTGSVGKTTLKEMIACGCTGRYRIAYTQKNYNNQIGVPKTIFEMDEDTQVLILELGLDRAGDIRRLAEIARPDIAAITNIGVSHRGNFDSDEGIFFAKMEIAEFLGSENVLIINGDDEKLMRVKKISKNAYRVLRAGMGVDCDFRLENLRHEHPRSAEDKTTGIAFRIAHGSESAEFSLNMPGLHGGIAAALAAAALSEIKIGLQAFSESLASYRPTARRLFIRENGGVTILDDTYNASPDSMRSGLEALMSLNGKRKIAVLGAMNDLGADSPKMHRYVGKIVSQLGVDVLVTVGEKAADIAKGAAEVGRCPICMHFDSPAAAAEALEPMMLDGDVYFVKGSNATKMNLVADALAEAERVL
ncbi:MAG: UDP-N-acetylmuramoyl-tripeptide--D-alanyl-D-alanine ligase [Clostridiales Family XIII bacterium]|jgi:UDP-N-acetylmuramoyl-tripeptide--D-alanyl-D-alanine ligase|nr:UDP-N-acetylmuramoyl-tripeptide--D-alanyl-D-alanine ligase [Clostridiales Family XIII bacterium]